MRSLFIILFFGFTSTTQAIPTITRGPYLQNVTANSIIIRWQTNEPTTSTVIFGTRKDRLTKRFHSLELTLNHEIKISRLKPKTKYFYAVGSNKQLITNSDTNNYFFTNPINGRESQSRIWVIGDSGRGNEGQLKVFDGALKYSIKSRRKANLWLMLGDNAYQSGEESEYQTNLFDIYKPILANTPLWPTFGNHDGYSASSINLTGPYYNIFSLPRNAESGGTPSGTEAYYSFDYGKVHLICLNSYDIDRGASQQMANWLRSDLNSTKQKWKIAFWHHPPYSKGNHDSDKEIELIEMRQNIVPILEEFGTDLVLSGHSHSYERSMLINGHYGLSDSLTPQMILNSTSGDSSIRQSYIKKTKKGTVYLVAGNGALVGAGNGQLNHPVMKTSTLTLGSLMIDISRNRLTSNFIDTNGEIVEKFSIDKR
jgi:hypothetical protein